MSENSVKKSYLKLAFRICQSFWTSASRNVISTNPMILFSHFSQSFKLKCCFFISSTLSIKEHNGLKKSFLIILSSSSSMFIIKSAIIRTRSSYCNINYNLLSSWKKHPFQCSLLLFCPALRLSSLMKIVH
jgi:hypothetical protein